MRNQAVLHGRRPHHTGRKDDFEGGNIPPFGFSVERSQQRFGERVTDNREVGHAVDLDRVE
ncbi:unannotated protein [freshwater metagenome]|uniref:Unannotated protein n=1 Tax=freshwater metagenome TaxID=449393 RepID=A0A6J6Y5M6_9ZZZZ